LYHCQDIKPDSRDQKSLETASVQKWHVSVIRDHNSNSAFHLDICRRIILKDLKEDLPSLSFVLVKGYPRAWQEFWEPIYSLSRQFGVDINVALEVFKLIYECVSKEEEGRPLSTGFLIGDSEKLKTRLPDSMGIDRQEQNIFDIAKTVRTLFGLVDGYTSAFIVGKDGASVDARLMPGDPPEPDESSFTYVEFHGYCSSLRDVPGYGIVASGASKTAKLFHDGALCAEVYFSGKVGSWVHRSLSEAKEKLDQVASEKRIPQRVLHKIFTTAITMSNHRKGGTMIVGDHEAVLAQSEPPRFRLSDIDVLSIKGRQEKHLFNLATQEFALVVSSEGEPKAASVRMLAKLPATMRPEVGPTDGGRHRSAAEMTAATDSVAFVVSDDGPITIYSEGKRILRV
jgi:DNA integrity scanning protein DisA with diadenylate cyclase activity